MQDIIRSESKGEHVNRQVAKIAENGKPKNGLENVGAKVERHWIKYKTWSCEKKKKLFASLSSV